MWRKFELNPRERLFLMKNGEYRIPNDMSSKDRYDIIGYCVTDSMIMSMILGSTRMKWSYQHSIIPKLIRYPLYYSKHKLPSGGMTDGKHNTDSIIDYCKVNNIDLSLYPAVNYCINYSPGYRDGEWYLPSSNELMISSSNSEKIMMDCRDAGIDGYIVDTILNNSYWSSTQISERESWSVNLRNYECNIHNKNSLLYVLPYLSV